MKWWLIRASMVGLGVFVMWYEGSQQPSPGIGFAIGMALFFATVFVGPVPVCSCGNADCGGGCLPRKSIRLSDLSREEHRALVDAGYAPLDEYIERWGS